MVSIATRKRFWVAAFLGIIVLFYTVKQADLHKFAQHLGDINPLWAAAVLASAFLSYACVAAVLDKLLKGIGLSIPFLSCLRISILSCTLNYLMSVGGLSGVAAKVYLLSREEIPPSNTLSVSIIHGFLTNTIAVLFIYLGFFYLYSQHQITERNQQVFGVLVLLIAFLLTWITIQTIVHERFRKKVWQIGFKVVTFFCEKIGRPQWISRERAVIFFENFNRSLNMILRNRAILITPASLALLDWILMFLCLKFSFIAINYPVNNKVLMVGFSIGLFMSLFSLTPASIGLTEGSMAWSFYLMDLDYESCLLAILIYRAAYYYIPIAVSILFFKHFFPSSDLGQKSGES